MLQKNRFRFKIAAVLLVCQLVACKSWFTDNEDYNPYKDESAEQLFNEAEKSLKKHEYSNAIKRFEAMDSMYPFHERAEQAQLDLIYAYYKKKTMLLVRRQRTFYSFISTFTKGRLRLLYESLG